MRILAILAALVATVSAEARTTPPTGSITVCSSRCKYSSVQGAVNALSTTTTSPQSIFIYPGNYTEQVTIPALAGKLAVYGYTQDTSSFAHNTVNIQHSSSLLSGAPDDEETGTLINLSADTAVYNINIWNTYGPGSQAIALSAYNTQQGYYGVGLYGYQDTLLAETGAQVYAASYIQGAVDFIFGQYATMWLTRSTVAVSAPGGAVTADGRDSATNPSYYVIDRSEVVAAAGATVPAGSVYLGRPWRDYARVCFQLCELSGIINSAGWEVWSESDPDTEFVVYQEYGNIGEGAIGTRANFSTRLSAAVRIETILGSNYTDWVDLTYL